MLEDRSYMREEPMRPVWSMTAILIAANIGVFILQEINKVYVGFPVNQYLALSKGGLKSFYLWQVITFQFLHGGFTHLLFNMICLYFFGRFAEERLGRINLLKIYLYSGIAGGLLQTLLGFVSPHFARPVVGASAGVYGLIAAFSLLEPHGIIRIWFIIPVRAIWFMYIAGGISLFYILVPAETGIAHAAHLGGLLGGAAFIRWDDLRERFFGNRPRVERYQPRSQLIRVPAAKRSPWGSRHKEQSEEMTPTEFISREVDPILDKISAHGVQSLTPKERQILEAARSKMRKR